MQRFKLVSQKRTELTISLCVRTGLKAGNCYEDCNNDLGVCMSGPTDNDLFALGVNCQAGYDQCVNKCMAE